MAKNDEETSTIKLRKSTKSRLESIKGKKDWSTFLEELYLENRNRRMSSKEKGSPVSELRELLDDEDLDRILATSKKFRRGFQLA
jgi:hypothetical protein